ncbi:uncharacterized protein LOC124644328 [Helicoverpa zea]|uniref:uncharacterized protein LOC124644328 n=1 Tax=Helicoverpa zea TaxID=7113 RepID=UPI001F59452E|nr:uncharacterized protein LOC124644328 [Helicoverpa zea]
MLRTTISRIKKVWTIAFVPRLLRGDQRIPPGKFDIISYAVQRKSPKSTKSEDGEKGAKNTEQDEGADYIFKCNEEPVFEDTIVDEHADPDDAKTKKIMNKIISSRALPKESQVEKCQRIIDKAFGKTEPLENMLAENYFSHSVNIEETRRKINEAEQEKLKLAQEKIISENRAQFGVFKMFLEPVTDKQEQPIGIDHLEAKVTNEKGKIAEEEGLDLVKEPFNVQLIAGKEPDLTKKLDSHLTHEETPLPLRENPGYEDIDRYIHDQEKLENKTFCDLQEIDKTLVQDISRLVKDEEQDDIQNVVSLGPGDSSNKYKMSSNPSCKAIDTSETDNRNVGATAENQKINNILNDFLTSAQRDTTLQATTASEAEEQLAQKVEHIDETPLVEAHKPKIEGFNVTPRVLGDADSKFSCSSQNQSDRIDPNKSTNMDIQADFDEVAKRCLDIPIGKIDEILLNEMEKIGIPVSANKDRSPMIENDLVQMDDARRPKGANDQQDLIVSDELRSAIEFSSADKLLHPSEIMNTNKVLPEQVEELENYVLESVPEDLREEDRCTVHPNQFFIYPYHKQAVRCHTQQQVPRENTENSKMKSAYYFMPTALRIENQEKMEAAYRSLAKSKMEQFTSTLKLCPTTERKTESEQLTSNTTELMSDSHNLSSYSGESGSASKLPQENTPLDSLVTLGDPNLSTYQKIKEIEQLKADLAAAESKLKEPLTGISADGTDSRQWPTLNAANITNDGRKSHNKGSHKPIYYGTTLAPKRPWSEEYYLRKTDQRYPQRIYTKGFDRISKYYQPIVKEFNHKLSKLEDKFAQKPNVRKSYTSKNEKLSNYFTVSASNKTRNDQSNRPEYKYGNREHPATRNMSAGYMWDYQRISPDRRTKRMQDSYDRGTANASNKVITQASTKEERADMKPTNSGYENIIPHRQIQSSKYRKTLIRNTVSKMNTRNNFNINVSDGIWDEDVEPAKITTKGKKETNKVSLPVEMLNEPPEPCYVLTYNETCPVSPKPAVGNRETSHVVDTTETNLRKDIRNTDMYQPGTSLIKTIDSKTQQALDSYMNRKPRSNYANVPDQTENLTGSVSLPNLSENVTLSELLKRVRERSRMFECRNELKSLDVHVEPAQGKYDRKSPYCPPVAAPRTPPKNPIPPPTFGLPALKRMPNACKPRKPRTRKCSTCDISMSGLHLGPKINAHTIEVGPEMVCEMNDADVGVCMRSKADLTEEVIDRLQSLGRMLGNVIHKGKTQLIDVRCLLRNQRDKTVLARNYEPWSPIPSWTEAKKPAKQSSRCDPGCKIFPPPRVCERPDPKCEQKPCSFPKKSFSMLDCFAVSLGDHKVYDLGEF